MIRHGLSGRAYEKAEFEETYRLFDEKNIYVTSTNDVLVAVRWNRGVINFDHETGKLTGLLPIGGSDGGAS